MSHLSDSSDGLPGPVVYKPHPDLKTSPHKAHSLNNFDPRKLGLTLDPKAIVDRQLLVKSNMGTTVLCDLDQFKRDVLPSLPPEKLRHALPTDAVDQAKATLSALLYEGGKKPREVKEDHIAETVVDKVLNKIAFPSKYKVALSRFKYDTSDPSRAKVDAAIYPEDRVPSDEAPNWTHCRFFIEFKKGDIKYDPWNDDESKNVEAERESRAAARAQLIAYARNVFLYQQRTALFTLLIIGDEFRVSRWDRSGVIVTKKANYGKNPKRLLEVVWHLVQLDDEQQGMDPTATLIEKGSKAFKVMDWLASPNSELDMDYEDTMPVGVKRPPTPYTYSDPCATEVDPELDPIVPVDDDPRVFRYVREKFLDSLVNGWPRYKLGVGPEGRIFLVGKPIFCSSTIFGRATEGFIAVEARTRRFAFLKDSWRPFYEGVEPEGTYLEMFANIPKMIVPMVLCHGDVAKQRAFAAVYEADPRRRKEESLRASQAAITRAKRGKKHARPEDEQEAADVATPTEGTVDDNGTLRHHIHYRIAVKDVCLPFESFKTTAQLIRLMRDCIKTHRWAYLTKRLLHRDISAGNVLILPRLIIDTHGQETIKWCGVLSDWELAKEVKEDASQEKARQPERTGTWHFMSVAFVGSQCTSPITIADELESFFHVTLFYAVRFLPSTVSNVSLFVQEYFDTFQMNGKGKRLCSTMKYDAVRKGPLSVQDEELSFLTKAHRTNKPINTLITKLRALFGARYENLARAKLQSRQVKAPAIPVSPNGAQAIPSLVPVAEERETRSRSQPSERSDSRNDAGPSSTIVEGQPEAFDGTSDCIPKQLQDHLEVLSYYEDGVDPTMNAPHDWIDTEATADRLVGYEPRIMLVNRTSYETGSRNTSGSQAKRQKSSANAVTTSSGAVHSMMGSSASGALPTTEEGD